MVEAVFKYAAFFYTPSDSVGYNWDGDYTEIIRIFTNSCKSVDITPVHLRFREDKALTQISFVVERKVPSEQLVYAREHAYEQCLKVAKFPVILMDPDQVILRPIPIHSEVAALCYRSSDFACFNGPRMITPKFIEIQKRILARMALLEDKYKCWDGDSLALADAVREYLMVNPSSITLVHPKGYIYRPKRNAAENSYMYHFKGTEGKKEMIEYAKANELL